MAEPSTEHLPEILDIVPNDLDEEIHSDLDRKILDKYPKTLLEAYLQIPGSVATDTGLVILLQEIVSSLEEKLDQKYMNLIAARRLLQDRPVLKEGLKSAWMKGKFKTIRNLSAPFRHLCVSYT